VQRRGKSLGPPLDDPVLGRGFLRVTTALPEQNDEVVTAFAAALAALSPPRLRG
jgi:histidinol-phosphate/aromatic aminotransferase/cobyric acid decarboxylase-like protein